MTDAKVWAVGVVKDERDILPYTLDHWLTQDIDGVLIADNLSDDGTHEIIQEYHRKYPNFIHPMMDREVAWYQARKMTELARVAASKGAQWIIPFDADEWWRGIGHHTVGEILRNCPHPIVGAKIWHYFATELDDPREPNPYKRMTWRNKEPSNLHKVAFVWRDGVRLEAGNHSLHFGNDRLMDYEYGIEMRHFPYRSAEQFLHGVENGYAALKATNLPRTYGGHWWMYGEHLDKAGPEGVKQWWRDHFYHKRPEDTLIYDPLSLLA